ncbi:SLATT domain-containing protein [Pseudomonas mandelii]|uniref:SLATT domain-containing protein n=1 Tax=Pseudomonas mandelii TaxID=75612 RepID=UPI0020A1D86B|nr:SLATT domain-containing protein [Pseudomonas mandelii]MCO8311818.1 SLATT domain-containing protein [Pseudomonas mandelii]
MSRLELLTKWNRMIVRLQIEHEISARDFEKFSWKLGIPCVVLSAIVSASVFGSISDSSPVWLQYVAGVLSLLTLVLSSVQTFLNFDTRAAGHKDTAEKLGAISREIQDEIASGKDEAILGPIVFDIRKRIDSILLDAPTLPKSTIRRLGDVRVHTEPPPAGQDTVPA